MQQEQAKKEEEANEKCKSEQEEKNERAVVPFIPQQQKFNESKSEMQLSNFNRERKPSSSNQ